MTVTIGTAWKLKKVQDGSTVMSEDLTNSYTATVGDAFAGVKRVRVASEGAARENIRDALKKISEKKS